MFDLLQILIPVTKNVELYVNIDLLHILFQNVSRIQNLVNLLSFVLWGSVSLIDNMELQSIILATIIQRYREMIHH